MLDLCRFGMICLMSVFTAMSPVAASILMLFMMFFVYRVVFFFELLNAGPVGCEHLVHIFRHLS